MGLCVRVMGIWHLAVGYLQRSQACKRAVRQGSGVIQKQALSSSALLNLSYRSAFGMIVCTWSRRPV